MQWNQARLISVARTELLGDVAPRRSPDPFALDEEKIERGAQALFEFVFSGTDRLGGQIHWASCEEKTKAGFRAEAKVVLGAVWPRKI